MSNPLADYYKLFNTETDIKNSIYCFRVMFIAFSHALFEDFSPHIDRLNMDGGNRLHVIEINVKGPVLSLFYDPELHRILWTDPIKEEISSVAVDGKNATHQISHLFRSFPRTFLYSCTSLLLCGFQNSLLWYDTIQF